MKNGFQNLILSGFVATSCLFSCNKKDDKPAPPPQEQVSELAVRAQVLKDRAQALVQSQFSGSDSCWEIGELLVQFQFLREEAKPIKPAKPVADQFKVFSYNFHEQSEKLGTILYDSNSSRCPTSQFELLQTELSENLVPWLNLVSEGAQAGFLELQTAPVVETPKKLLQMLLLEIKELNTRIESHAQNLFSYDEMKNQEFRLSTWSWSRFEILSRANIDGLSANSKYRFKQLTLLMRQLKNESLQWNGLAFSAQELRKSVEIISIDASQILDDDESQQ